MCLVRLHQEWKISRLTFEYDSEPFGKDRDAAIKKLAMEAGVEVIVKISHTLYDLDKYVVNLSLDHHSEPHHYELLDIC